MSVRRPPFLLLYLIVAYDLVRLLNHLQSEQPIQSISRKKNTHRPTLEGFHPRRHPIPRHQRAPVEHIELRRAADVPLRTLHGVRRARGQPNGENLGTKFTYSSDAWRY